MVLHNVIWLTTPMTSIEKISKYFFDNPIFWSQWINILGYLLITQSSTYLRCLTKYVGMRYIANCYKVESVQILILKSLFHQAIFFLPLFWIFSCIHFAKTVKFVVKNTDDKLKIAAFQDIQNKNLKFLQNTPAHDFSFLLECIY